MQEVVGDIPELKQADEDHRGRNRAVQFQLLGCERQVYRDPGDEPGAGLAE